MSRNPEVTADLVRAMYPDPSSGMYQKTELCAARASGAYCVGGALVQCIGGDANNRQFPTPTELRIALMQANPTLPEDRAEDYASYLIYANDKGRFDDAWNWLEQALE